MSKKTIKIKISENKNKLSEGRVSTLSSITQLAKAGGKISLEKLNKLRLNLRNFNRVKTELGSRFTGGSSIDNLSGPQKTGLANFVRMTDDAATEFITLIGKMKEDLTRAVDGPVADLDFDDFDVLMDLKSKAEFLKRSSINSQKARVSVTGRADPGMKARFQELDEFITLCNKGVNRATGKGGGAFDTIADQFTNARANQEVSRIANEQKDAAAKLDDLEKTVFGGDLDKTLIMNDQALVKIGDELPPIGPLTKEATEKLAREGSGLSEKNKVRLKKMLIILGAGAAVLALLSGTPFNTADADDEKPTKPVKPTKPTSGGTTGTSGQISMSSSGKCPVFNKEARTVYGNKLSISGAVKKIQTGLQKLKFNLGPTGIDGKCGDYTVSAVYDFQTILLEKGFAKPGQLGTTGPAKDGRDGIMGPKTFVFFQKALKGEINIGAGQGTTGGAPRAKKGSCDSEQSFKVLPVNEKIKCALNKRKYVDIARAYYRFRDGMRQPIRDVLFSSEGAIKAAKKGGYDEDKVIRYTLDQMLPLFGVTSDLRKLSTQQSIKMANKMLAIHSQLGTDANKYILVSAPDNFIKQIQSGAGGGELAMVFDYRFTRKELINTMEAAVDKYVKPWITKKAPADFDAKAGDNLKKKLGLQEQKGKRYDLEFSKWQKMFN